jgi:hypothetical protein
VGAISPLPPSAFVVCSGTALALALFYYVVIYYNFISVAEKCADKAIK